MRNIAVVMAFIALAFILGLLLNTRPEASSEIESRNPDIDHSNKALQTADSAANGRVGEPRSKLDIDQPPPIPLIRFDASMSVDDYLATLEERELVNQQEANYIRHSWIETCVDVLWRTGSSMKHGGSYDPGPAAEVLYQLSERCEEFLPDSIGISDGKIIDHTDVLALRELIEELTPENSYHEKGTRLEESYASGGVDALTRDALDILINAMDEASLITALKHLVGRGALDPSPPFGNYHNADQSPYFHEITNDVALVLLCERIGGCSGSNHPIVLRRCFQHHFGCMRAMDIHDAIYQTTPPVQYEIFWTLLTETRRLMAKRRH